MSERFEQELELLRSVHPELEYRQEAGLHWVRIASWALPAGVFDRDFAGIAFQIPPHAGQAPYGFWVHPGLQLAKGGNPGSYTYPTATPWGQDWGQFSWSPCSWMPTADIRCGSNMLQFVRSFADRLSEES